MKTNIALSKSDYILGLKCPNGGVKPEPLDSVLALRLQAKFAVRAEANELQCFRVWFPVDQH